MNDGAFLLTVVNVQPADVGDYICNASNGVGQLVATLKIRGEIHIILTDILVTNKPYACIHLFCAND